MSEVEAEKLASAVEEANASGMTQQAIAETLHVTQPYVSSLVKRARERSASAVDGLGTSPLSIARHYAAGQISRQQCLIALKEWPYTEDEAPPLDRYYDALIRGDHAELGEALSLGYLDDDMYGEILETLAAKFRARDASATVDGRVSGA